MANPEHLEILNQGVEAWNKWRDERQDVLPNLSHANLSHADLVSADLNHADLSFAYLNGAVLINADLSFANLSRADLSLANLTYARVDGINLSYAYLSGADFTDAGLALTTFAGNDLSEVKGLEAARHLFPSSIGVDTLYKSAGKIPEAFLRGCGVPESFIVRGEGLRAPGGRSRLPRRAAARLAVRTGLRPRA